VTIGAALVVPDSNSNGVLSVWDLKISQSFKQFADNTLHRAHLSTRFCMAKTITLRLEDSTYDILKKVAEGQRRAISNYLEF
jgi:hypothetical protein